MEMRLPIEWNSVGEYSSLSINPNITWDDVKEGNREVKWDGALLSQNPGITWDDVKEALEYYPFIKWFGEGLSRNPNFKFDDLQEAYRNHRINGWYGMGSSLSKNINITWDDVKKSIMDNMNLNIIWNTYELAKNENITWDNIKEGIENNYGSRFNWGKNIWLNPNLTWENVKEGIQNYPDRISAKKITMSPGVNFEALLEILETNPSLVDLDGLPLSNNPNITWTDIINLIKMGYQVDDPLDFIYSGNISYEEIEEILMSPGDINDFFDYNPYSTNSRFEDLIIRLSRNNNLEWSLVDRYSNYGWNYDALSTNMFGWGNPRKKTLIKPART